MVCRPSFLLPGSLGVTFSPLWFDHFGFQASLPFLNVLLETFLEGLAVPHHMANPFEERVRRCRQRHVRSRPHSPIRGIVFSSVKSSYVLSCTSSHFFPPSSRKPLHRTVFLSRMTLHFSCCPFNLRYSSHRCVHLFASFLRHPLTILVGSSLSSCSRVISPELRGGIAPFLLAIMETFPDVFFPDPAGPSFRYGSP